MDVLWALLLIGLALFVGGIVLRSLPSSWLAFGAVLVVFGLGIPALVIDDRKSETADGGEAAAPEETGGTTTAEEEEEEEEEGGEQAEGEREAGGGREGGGDAALIAQGKQLFTQNCGTCHTLADAGTNGKVGPNLDDIAPDKQVVQAAIENGGQGTGAMPANIVTGEDAEAVATYVAEVAGR